MATLDELICRNPNPFDPLTFRVENFWEQNPGWTEAVESIHLKELQQLEGYVRLVAEDHQTRSYVLIGDSGCGKSYMLGRLKRRLNAHAFFVYIGPWDDDTYIWRHILRYTVNSLMRTPEGETESQLLLWLKSLPAIQQPGLLTRLMSEKQRFIKYLKNAYTIDIYQPHDFFSALYGLTQPDLQVLACEWLRGDVLAEEDADRLGVKTDIDNEYAAKEMLANIGRISVQTKPIVLCFDQIDKVALPNTTTTLNMLWSVNSTLHNSKVPNLCIIISLIAETWNLAKGKMLQADRARLHKGIQLHPISWQQAEALWELRLHGLHCEAEPRPASPLAPLEADHLIFKFPGGKLMPRSALQLGNSLYQAYKQNLRDRLLPVAPVVPEPAAVDRLPETSDSEVALQAAFQLVWQHEHRNVQQEVQAITQFASYELLAMLREVMLALEAQVAPIPFHSKTYSAYGLQWQQELSRQVQRVTAVVWTEDVNLTKFCNLMKACQKLLDGHKCNRLCLIRYGTTGNPKNKGFQIYRQIMSNSAHQHLCPSLSDVHYLYTYRRLVNAACAGELVVADQTPNLQELQRLVRRAGVLEACTLMQALGLLQQSSGRVGGAPNNGKPIELTPPVLSSTRDYVLNFMKVQGFLSRQKLLEYLHRQLPDVGVPTIEMAISSLCNESRLTIIDSTVPLDAQLICYVPQAA
ncbi:MAG: ATP-binding protein [Cyanobacteria bacterium]|nr:ATP-binding protein [Cyanobacteriota bacterium]MDW8201347.1 ATP-binding protein [Cyanobacteriota bacterium SKYGB_h_bin112]